MLSIISGRASDSEVLYHRYYTLRNGIGSSMKSITPFSRPSPRLSVSMSEPNSGHYDKLRSDQCYYRLYTSRKTAGIAKYTDVVTTLVVLVISSTVLSLKGLIYRHNGYTNSFPYFFKTRAQLFEYRTV